MSRNFEYLTTVHAATNRIIQPYIFNTDKIPDVLIDYANPTMFFNPIWINTQEIEASVKLNNIRYKIDNQIVLNVYDIFDLIWIPKFRSNKQIDELIMELIDIFNEIIAEEKYLIILRKCLILWAGKYVEGKENINKVIGGLKLSTLETDDLHQMIRSARIEGALLRSKQQGHKEGLEEGLEKGLEKGRDEGRDEGFADAEEKFISKLLETKTPEEISEEFNISLYRVVQIQYGDE